MDKPRKGSFLSDVASVFSARVLILVIKFAAGVVLARYMGANGRGLLAAVTVAPTLIASLADMGVRQAAARSIARERATIEDVTSALMVLFVASSVLGVGACLLYSRYFGLPSFTPELVILASLSVPGTILISYCSGIFLGRQQIAKFNRLGWIPELIRFGIILGVAMWGTLTVGLSLVAQLIAGGLMGVYGVLLARRLTAFQWRVNFPLIRSLLTVSSAFALSLLVVNLNYRVNTIVLQNVSTLSQLGYFTVALSLVELVLQIPTALSSIVFARSAGAKDDQAFTLKVVVLMRWSALASAGAGLVICAASPLLVPLAYGEEFAASVPVIFMLMPGVVAISAFRLLAIDMNGKGKPLLALWAAVPALLINIGFSALLSPRWGAMGAAAASSISYVLLTAIYLMIYRRVAQLKLRDILLFRSADVGLLLDYLPPLRKLVGRLRR